MSMDECFIALLCSVDEAMENVPKPTQATKHPGKIVTFGLLFSIKGVGPCAFYCWL